jgi:site-specific recombinase XerD
VTGWPNLQANPRGGHVHGGRLTDRSVANIIKTHAENAGFDPDMFSGHSLRAGLLTSAAKQGANVFKMMASSRHRSIETLSTYVRDQELFKDHAGAGLL